MAARAGSIHLVMDLLKYCCYSPRFGHARAHHAQFPIFNKRRRRKLYSGVKHNTLLSMKPLMHSTHHFHVFRYLLRYMDILFNETKKSCLIIDRVDHRVSFNQWHWQCMIYENHVPFAYS